MHSLNIPPFSEEAANAAKRRLDSLAKVPGSLGRLEELAVRLAGITGRERPAFPKKGVVLFAADHDITLQGVSASCQEVTAIQVRNFLRGGGTLAALVRNAGRAPDFRAASCTKPAVTRKNILMKAEDEACGKRSGLESGRFMFEINQKQA